MTAQGAVPRTLLLAALLGATQVLAAPAREDLARELQLRLELAEPGARIPSAGTTVRLDEPLLRFYRQRDYRPAWTEDGSPSAQADELIDALAAAETHGLDPHQYRKSLLGEQVALARARLLPAVAGLVDVELLLTRAFLDLGEHLLRGRLDPSRVDRDWLIERRRGDLVAVLERALTHGTIAHSLEELAPVQPAYARLREALIRYRRMALDGEWATVESGPRLELGSRDARVAALRRRLATEGDLPPAAGTPASPATVVPEPDAELFDQDVLHAVRRFQRRHGLEPDGIVGPRTLDALNVTLAERIRQIQVNLERWRWLPWDFGRRYILVNVSGFAMQVVEEGSPVMDARIVVGMEQRPTPTFTADLSYLVFSPYWNVPRSIAVKDKLPLLRDDAYALHRQRIRIFDREGVEVDPGEVDWSLYGRNNFPFRMRQDPGDQNALGRVKFMLPNEHAIYLHDTPTPHLFQRAERTYSSGCIRVENPLQLAEYLLRDSERWNADAILAAYNGTRERSVSLSEKVPVYLVYWTAWADEEGVQFRRDIYNRDPRMVDAMFPRSESVQALTARLDS